MSRIGKLPVAIPAGVKVAVDGNTVKVEGPKGKLEKTFNAAASFVVEDNEIKVSPADSTRFANSMYGTARSIVANMVQGVVEGYSKDLEINGVGFGANLKGKVLNLKLGFSHDIDYEVPEGVTITMDGSTKLKVSGIDKHMVGQAAASIKKFAPAEPYKGKGVRIVGEHVIRKEGKSV
ncbi:50S ribosomal protein L6 [Pelagicoccus sp. SDUM812003]|uniref:50S ribosomal protein L6 n=1 Tax=Pelagicoccus sp. SDUM812003 TaxID=3041267 RepID=UPI00280FC06A|nr:50S ribosomal protein L6 [Pelagicoccus sp. SDUM812003]MDQ8204837.1 50S ribosomal protein L6 [Pelagicoccus sp. SDUM812003]